MSLSRGHVIRSVTLLSKTNILHTLCKNFLAHHQLDVHWWTEFPYTLYRQNCPSWIVRNKRADTVGQPPGTEIGVPNIPSLKAKKLSKLPREKVLLEL